MNKLALRIAATLLLAVVFLLLLDTNMRKGLSHDEHMYVAGGALISGSSMLPYRDFPYLQMPNLALLYGLVFTFTDHLLLAARLLNTLFAALILAAIGYHAAALFPPEDRAARLLVGTGSAILVVLSPIFFYSSGLSWNHDLPVLLTVLAFVLGARAGENQGRWLLCGLLVGLAAGTRLSFAIVLIPFAAWAVWLPGVGSRAGLRRLGGFALGCLLGLLPAIALAATAPARFAFDNWTYHQLNEAYWQAQGYTRAMTLEGKLGYMLEVAAQPGTLVLLFGLALVGVALVAGAAGVRQYSPGLLAGALAVVLTIGTLAPTPTWFQYYYAPLPFLALALAHGLATVYSAGRWRRQGLGLFAAIMVVTGTYGLGSNMELDRGSGLAGWVPIEAHRVGVEVERAVGNGKVLTLSPLFPLEGGARIYESLAAGPFAWRLASLVPEEDRQRLRSMSPADLENLSRTDPPAGILTGLEGPLDEPLVQLATRLGYRQVTLSNGATLWLP